MNIPLRLKLLFKKYKIYIGYFLAFFFFLLYLGKGGYTYVETKEVIIDRPISYVSSPDLFTESASFILKEGKDGKEERTFTVDDNELIKTKVIEKAEEQKEIKGTLKYTDVKVDIQNLVSQYLQDVINKNYMKLNDYYTSFSKTSLSTSKDNWDKIKQFKGNFIIKENEPLYDVNSSKAIVKTIAQGNYYDSVTETNESSLEIYSLYDSQTGEFKVLNPEYIPIPVKDKEKKLKLIEKTKNTPTHNLQITLQRNLLHFPNELLFKLDVRSSDNIIFNRIKLQLKNKKTGEIIYEEKQNYKDFNPNVQWNTSIFQKRIGYATNFWVKIAFNKQNFGTIYDKLFIKDNIALYDYELIITPINDSYITIDYPPYTFDL